MISLGLTKSAQTLPPSLEGRKLGDLTLILAPKELTATARARLKKQVEAYRYLDSFIPFAIRSDVAPSKAEQFTVAHRSELCAKMERLSAHGQITVIARCAPVPKCPNGGRNWLEARAAMLRRQDVLSDHLTELMSSSALMSYAGEHRVSVQSSGLAMHMLVKRANVDACLELLNQALSRPSSYTENWQLTLSGDWPPAAFCQDLTPHEHP